MKRFIALLTAALLLAFIPAAYADGEEFSAKDYEAYIDLLKDFAWKNDIPAGTDTGSLTYFTGDIDGDGRLELGISVKPEDSGSGCVYFYTLSGGKAVFAGSLEGTLPHIDSEKHTVACFDENRDSAVSAELKDGELCSTGNTVSVESGFLQTQNDCAGTYYRLLNILRDLCKASRAGFTGDKPKYEFRGYGEPGGVYDQIFFMVEYEYGEDGKPVSALEYWNTGLRAEHEYVYSDGVLEKVNIYDVVNSRELGAVRSYNPDGTLAKEELAGSEELGYCGESQYGPVSDYKNAGYTYKYDELGRLLEKYEYVNDMNGAFLYKSRYTYAGNTGRIESESCNSYSIPFNEEPDGYYNTTDRPDFVLQYLYAGIGGSYDGSLLYSTYLQQSNPGDRNIKTSKYYYSLGKLTAVSTDRGGDYFTEISSVEYIY